MMQLSLEPVDQVCGLLSAWRKRGSTLRVYQSSFQLEVIP